MRPLTCDGCGCNPRKPAINLALRVYCARCAPHVGMDVGEHNPIRSYEAWKSKARQWQAKAYR